MPHRPLVARNASDDALWRLVDALPIAIWTARPDGRPDYLNTALQGVIGTADAANLERSLHPDDLRALTPRWMAAMRRPSRLDGRCRLHRAADGSWRWHTLRAVPMLDDTGQVVRWLCTCVDDHEFRRLVEVHQEVLAAEQQARQVADDAVRMKDEFLATLAHELRTPLNAISGWAGLLRREGLSPADHARAVDVIERNARAQRQLIDELLDVSRVISGHVRLDQQTLVLDDVVSEAVGAVRAIAEARGLRLEWHGATTPTAVWGDAARLRQVCDKLLSNAVKFTPSGGSICVRLRADGPRVMLEVVDTGIGIAPDFLPLVFERFRQAESPAARRYGGLGLGLAAARQIVRMHGGDVVARSEGEGHGATFTITLPPGGDHDASSTMGPGLRDSATDGAPSALRGQSILVIEDDPDSREMLSVVLENAGGVPVGAASVADALRLLGDLQIDVVLSDIGMPGRDGFDLIRALRSSPHPRVRQAPAIAVTAFARAEDRARVLEAGFDAHVPKPVEPARLLVTIADVCQRRQARASAVDPLTTPNGSRDA